MNKRFKILSSPRDAGPFFDEQAGNDQSSFAWRSVSLCVSLMSHTSPISDLTSNFDIVTLSQLIGLCPFQIKIEISQFIVNIIFYTFNRIYDEHRYIQQNKINLYIFNYVFIVTL
jgi:hypothetical protein